MKSSFLQPMKYWFILILALLSLSAARPADSSSISLTIKGLEEFKGKVAIELLDEQETRVGEAWEVVSSSEVSVQLDGLADGMYAIRFFHDANNSGHMDKNWIGIPTEAFGFSNDAKVRFGPPSFDAMKFEVKGHTSITINAQSL